MGRNFSRFTLDHPLCARVAAELDDETALEAACRGAESVIHSAALSAPWGRRAEYQRVNVDGTERLLRCAARAGVRRFVHVSSSSVTFDNQDRYGVTESQPEPATFLSLYSWSKARAEDAVRRSQGLETVIVRPRAIFGPNDTSLLPRLLRLAREGGLRVIGDGKNLQDLTYVDNVVDSLLLARDSAAAPGRTYFVTNDEPVPVWDLIKQFLAALGLPVPNRRVPLGVAYAAAASMELLHQAIPRLGEPKLTRYTVSLLGRAQTFDIRAVKEELGYRPRVDMSEALARTVDFFRGAAHV
jgi:nucleoside-diphosphate-sugar epimerase